MKPERTLRRVATRELHLLKGKYIGRIPWAGHAMVRESLGKHLEVVVITLLHLERIMITSNSKLKTAKYEPT